MKVEIVLNLKVSIITARLAFSKKLLGESERQGLSWQLLRGRTVRVPQKGRLKLNREIKSTGNLIHFLITL